MSLESVIYSNLVSLSSDFDVYPMYVPEGNIKNIIVYSLLDKEYYKNINSVSTIYNVTLELDIIASNYDSLILIRNQILTLFNSCYLTSDYFSRFEGEFDGYDNEARKFRKILKFKIYCK